MSKRFKIAVSVILAALMLTFGGAAAALAQEEPEAPANGILSRVAEILGIPYDELSGAIEQAREEVREDCQESGNCTREGYQERRFGKQDEWAEKKQEQINKYQNRWTEKRQEWVEKRRGPGGNPGNAAAGNGNRARVSRATQTRQMTAVPEGWQGTLPAELAGQGVLW